MTEGQQQRLFARLVGEFLVWICDSGYEVTFGECYRTPEQAALNAQHKTGIANSVHTHKMAIDLNLFFAGVFKTDLESYRPVGEHWKTMHELCRWGGDFKNEKGDPAPDADHFSMEWQGVK